MKDFFKVIAKSILIILPLILIVMLVIWLNVARCAVSITKDNIEIINELLDLNEVGFQIDENVKEIAIKKSKALAYSRYEIVYKNDEVKDFTIEILRQDKSENDSKLSRYIRENDGHYHNPSTWIIIFIISLIVSIYLIFNSEKTREIY